MREIDCLSALCVQHVHKSTYSIKNCKRLIIYMMAYLRAYPCCVKCISLVHVCINNLIIHITVVIIKVKVLKY